MLGSQLFPVRKGQYSSLKLSLDSVLATNQSRYRHRTFLLGSSSRYIARSGIGVGRVSNYVAQSQARTGSATFLAVRDPVTDDPEPVSNSNLQGTCLTNQRKIPTCCCLRVGSNKGISVSGSPPDPNRICGVSATRILLVEHPHRFSVDSHSFSSASEPALCHGRLIPSVSNCNDLNSNRHHEVISLAVSQIDRRKQCNRVTYPVALGLITCKRCSTFGTRKKA